ncbi:MAG: flagellar hook-length control protein FliK [Lachnospiraceae bacterium]|nr:flagellar hook-length control protein FliK [Lachnospiraceae bacterium]
MRLSSYIGQINQNIVEIPGNDGASLEQGLRNGMEAIYGKQSGESITGEVLSRTGNEILLSLGQNQLLQAKLEGSMTAQQGQLMTFQIRNNAGGKVVLTPLFENLSQDPNISKALSQAGIPENNITAQMVKAMMQEGLPIDRQSLYQMNRLVNANPQADIQTLAQMQRLSLPVTPENIVQFEAYKSYQHQLSGSLMEIADAFTQTFQEITGNGNLSEGLEFYKNVVSTFLEGTPEAEGEPLLQTEDGKVVAKSAEGLPEQKAELTGERAVNETAPKLSEALTGEETAKLAENMKQAGASGEFVQNMLTGKVTTQEFLNQVERLLSEGEAEDKSALFSLLDGKEFKSVLKNEMSRQWLLLPEEVAEENKVDKLYEKLNSQMKQLSQTLEQTARGDTPLARTVANVSNNIDFMNQMNQMFTYVQLPLKMQGKEAHGELFVYTNKKNLAKKEGTVSALLHLDMEHLGSVDVHVALTDQKVATKFYLKDDRALDLIADHIDLLNERLNKRGYSMTAQFLNKTDDTNVMDEILDQNKNISVLSGYSFDARA